MYRADKIEQLFEILCFEIDCIFDPRTQHLYILQRGSSMGPIGDLQLIKSEPDHGVSFSNGLAGMINDQNACAWWYYGGVGTPEFEDENYSEENNVGYALLFDPNSIYASALFIPHIMSHLAVYAFGEHFHPRHFPAENNLFEKLLNEQTVVIKSKHKIDDYNNPPKSKEMLLQYILQYKNKFREPILQEQDGKPRIKSKL